MKKMITTYFVILTFVVVFSSAKAESFDPEAISQVSKGIAEWKLINEDKTETQMEQTVYVSSSLSGMVERVERDDSGWIRVVSGLAAFDNDYQIESQIRQWELNRGIGISNEKMSSLTKIWDINKTLGKTAMKTELGAGVKMTKFGPIWGPISTIESGYSTATKVFQTYGTSMQIMNPPIYLHEKTSYGWRGEGSYNINGMHVKYQETLNTAGPGSITRTHTDWVTTNTGTYYRHVEIKTPATSNFERFVLNRYPVGSYWDTNSSVSYTTTRSHQSYRIETVGDISKVTPLPSSGFGKSYGGVGSNWNSPPPTFKMPTYSPYSIPKMPTYTPTMPSSSRGRKY